MTNREAGRLGGLKTVSKHGKEHMQSIGRKGAEVTWTRYKLVPTGIAEFAMVDRATGKVVAIRPG